jgi:hypothetical protein
VSSNVGIDFTELGPPHGSKPGGTSPLKGAGCRKTRRPDNDRLSGQTEGKGDHSRLC